MDTPVKIDPTAVELATHIATKKGSIGTFLDAEGKTHRVLLMPATKQASITTHETPEKIQGQAHQKLVANKEEAKPLKHTINPLDNEEAKALIHVFDEALTGTQHPDEIATLTQAKTELAKLTKKDALGEEIELFINDIRSPREGTVPLIDYTRFFAYFNLSDTSGTIQNPKKLNELEEKATLHQKIAEQAQKELQPLRQEQTILMDKMIQLGQQKAEIDNELRATHPSFFKKIKLQRQKNGLDKELQTIKNSLQSMTATIESLTQREKTALSEAATAKNQSNELRQTQMCSTLRALTESKEEIALVEAMIQAIDQEVEKAKTNTTKTGFEKSLEISSALTSAVNTALSKHSQELPKPLQYVLIAAGQTAFAPITNTLSLSVVGRETGLSCKATPKRQINVHMERREDGSLSKLIIQQKQEIAVLSDEKLFAGQKSDEATIIRAPIDLKTTIELSSEGKEEALTIEIATPSKASVTEQANSPRYQEYMGITDRIEHTFGKRTIHSVRT